MAPSLGAIFYRILGCLIVTVGGWYVKEKAKIMQKQRGLAIG